MPHFDADSLECLKRISEEERCRAHRVPGVRTVLVVLSSSAMVYDADAIRHKIILTYPEAAVFFTSTMGKPLGSPAPQHVDLLIDLTGPGEREKFMMAKRLRRMARVIVGRNAGLFRKKIYDRVFDEKAEKSRLPEDSLERERVVQKKVLGLSGISYLPTGDTPPDRGKLAPLDHSPLRQYE